MAFFHKLYLYFLPGILPTALLILLYHLTGKKLPSITLLICIDFLITIPLMCFLIAKHTGQPFGLQALWHIFSQQKHVPMLTAIGTISLSLVWALGMFILMKPIQLYLEQHVFAWIPEWFTPGLFAGQHAKSILKYTWLLMIPFAILMPTMEEVYFRGFLLPREPLNDWRAPLFNTVLFCAYHIWSPSVFVTRVVATFPMNFFVWKYQNIFLSIVPHVLLNLVGDVILTYPVVFP